MLKETVELSLIIPTLGRTHQVQALLESILHANINVPFEVLVIDQNTDGCLDEIIQTYQKQLPLVRYNVSFKGASRARNYGVTRAKGHFVCFPDDDAELCQNTIATALDLLKNTNYDMIFGKCIDKQTGMDSIIHYGKEATSLTPSKWLADLVKQSFLKEYPVEVVYNTVDKTIFRPTPSDFRRQHGLEDKKIILGVASVWDERKGLNDFIKLAKMLDDKYSIVLVGLTDKQIKSLPKNCLGIKRTHSPQELATIYSAADVFFNPSREETFGLTTLEALSCGTQAVVYAGTACEEVARQYGGQVIAIGDFRKLLL